ncbi:uncharacterized protein LOC123512264 [Portunus trituberculatus]|uniref:uncharacterized protein LOC123512264 n=1 Tax=Portunus trituberculatus TaxID=210409 RepID=UPI001E1CBD7B|nr:uncharacterized protein LOC123512264 [Portunus trituberculatus]XP_045124491.1 uncharacterized protein LOC123512264 [Portunus trituberculatus]
MGRQHQGGLLGLSCVLYALATVTGVQITSLSVPPVVMSGDKAKLTCAFRLAQGDRLYSLTWWKDGTMFFKYVIGNPTPVTIYEAPGISVDVSASSLQEVVLSRVDHRASGTLRCEVLTDRLFEQVTRDANLTVVDPPSRGPVITGRKEKYRIGDLLLLNCTAGHSFPATSLTWAINGEKASHETVVHYPGHTDAHGCTASWSGLQMVLRHAHFRKGVLSLTCTASIAHVYRKATQVVVADPSYQPPYLPPLEGASTGGGSSVHQRAATTTTTATTTSAATCLQLLCLSVCLSVLHLASGVSLSVC